MSRLGPHNHGVIEFFAKIVNEPNVPAGDMVFIQLRAPTTGLVFFTANLINVCAFEPGDISPITTFNDCFAAPLAEISPTSGDEFVCYPFSINFLGTSDDCGFLLTVFKTLAPANGELTFTTSGVNLGDVAVLVLEGECQLDEGTATKDGSSLDVAIEDATLLDCQNLDNGPTEGQEKVELTGLTPGAIICFLVYAVGGEDEPTTFEPATTGTGMFLDIEEATVESANVINSFGSNIKVSLQSDLPDVFSNPEQLFASQNEITFGDPCSCEDPRNCTEGGVQYFHDTLTIPASLATTPGLTINVSSATNFFIDVPCFGAGLTNATNELIPEVSPGVYKIEFWRPSGVTPTLAVTVNGGGPITAPAATFQPVCTTEACEPEMPIPTMSEWGLMIFGLLVLNLGVLLMRRKEDLLA